MTCPCTTAELTGEPPLEAVLSSPYAWNGDQISYTERLFGWLGCIDAPELLPAGGCRPIYIDPDVGGMGFEGACSLLWRRSRDGKPT